MDNEQNGARLDTFWGEPMTIEGMRFQCSVEGMTDAPKEEGIVRKIFTTGTGKKSKPELATLDRVRARLLGQPYSDWLEFRDGGRPMRPINIKAAKYIADWFGYDQVIIIGRRVGEANEPHGEHCTTYGVNKAHCDVAARCGDRLKHEVMGWPRDEKKGR